MGCISGCTLRCLQVLAMDIEFSSVQPAGEIHAELQLRAWLCSLMLGLQLLLFGQIQSAPCKMSSPSQHGDN